MFRMLYTRKCVEMLLLFLQLGDMNYRGVLCNSSRVRSGKKMKSKTPALDSDQRNIRERVI